MRKHVVASLITLAISSQISRVRLLMFLSQYINAIIIVAAAFLSLIRDRNCSGLLLLYLTQGPLPEKRHLPA